MSLHDSAVSGDRAKTLCDLRDLLAKQIDSCDSLRDLASLSGRLQSVLTEIAALEKMRPAGDGIDEIAARRSTRRSRTTANSSRAKRSG